MPPCSHPQTALVGRQTASVADSLWRAEPSSWEDAHEVVAGDQLRQPGPVAVAHGRMVVVIGEPLVELAVGLQRPALEIEEVRVDHESLLDQALDDVPVPAALVGMLVGRPDQRDVHPAVAGGELW
jgi:hypothetical protein